MGLTYGGAVGIYSRANGSWTRSGTLPALSSQPYDLHCAWDVELSGDGRTAVHACGDRGEAKRLEIFTAPAWNRRDTVHIESAPADYRPVTVAVDHAANTIAVGWQPPFGPGVPDNPPPFPRVDVFERSGGAYLPRATLRAGAWQTGREPYRTQFAQSSLALSGDGALLAVGDPIDRADGGGPLPPPVAGGAYERGAAYLFERRSGGWALRRLVKPDNGRRVDSITPNVGASAALGGNGRTLAVGDPYERTCAPNPGSAQANPRGLASGAVWIY